MASKQFFIDIDLIQNQLKNGVIHTLAAHPTTPAPVTGQIYYNTVAKTVYIFDGTNWINLFNVLASDTVTGLVQLADSTQITAGTDTESGQPLVVKPSQLKSVVDAAKTMTVSGDLSGNLPSPVVEQSTSSDGFLIKTGAYEVRLVSTASGTVSVRNSANTADGDLVASDLHVKGDLTVDGVVKQVSTETIQLEDSIIVLNNNETGTPSQNAGIEVERGTSVNVTLLWNETSDKWEIFDGINTYQIVRKYSTTITGTGVATTFGVTHGLGTKDVQIQVFDSDYKVIEAEFVSASITLVNINFNQPPALDVTYKVVVVG